MDAARDPTVLAAGTAEKVAIVSLAVSLAVFSCVGLFAVGSIFTNGSPSFGTLTQATNTAQGTLTVNQQQRLRWSTIRQQRKPIYVGLRQWGMLAQYMRSTGRV